MSDKLKQDICELAKRGLWEFDASDEEGAYDRAREAYEDFCLDGAPLHALECPECGGKGSWLEEWYTDDDWGWYDDPCTRCKGRGIIRLEDETEEEGERRAERQRPKKNTLTFQVHNAGLLNGHYRVFVTSEISHGSNKVFFGDSYEQARERACSWVEKFTQNLSSSLQ